MDRFLAKLDRAIIFSVIYTFCFVIFFKTIAYTLPFVLALLFAFIIQIPTNLLIKKLKLKNYIAALITTTIFSLTIIFIMVFIIASITNEGITLAKNAQTYVVQASPKVNNLVDSLQKIYKNLDPSIANTIEQNLSSYVTKTLSTTLDISGKLMTYIVNLVSSIPYVVMVITFTFISTYFFTRDLSNAKHKFKDSLPSDKSDKILDIITHVKKMFFNYFLSELIIIGITLVETLIAYSVLGVNYIILLSLITAICDFLPIVGIAIIYFPAALIYLLMGNYFTAIGLVIAYVVISIIRQIIEPKIVSSTMGIHPVAALAALFIGLQAGGVMGIIFCMFYVLIFNMLKNIEIL
ncbi:sporulation integral membrane protein YtvI [Clostridium akagii]|uniref:sporulation integral membrane protein YtvI n=1 Tax=Clostridium akagii TaxID=91623 RepID=UPI000479B6CC|nr:sporulation integral membrane protein YtvI [Clostridium akagii]